MIKKNREITLDSGEDIVGSAKSCLRSVCFSGIMRADKLSAK